MTGQRRDTWTRLRAAAGAALTWLRWKLACLAWRFEPGWNCPGQIHWNAPAQREPAL
jgi:hypothetical protein